MRRVYLPSDLLQAGEVSLAEEERRYVARVLRLHAGEEIELFDGAGRRARATLSVVTGRAVRCQVETPRQDPAPDGPRLHLGLPLIKGERLDLAVRMLTEIGVSAITLLICERSVRRAEDAAAARMQRLQRVARAAARQCGRAQLPDLDGPLPLADFAAQAGGEKLYGDLAGGGAASLPAALARASAGGPLQEICLCTGPEGGFSDEERAELRAHGFSAVALGPHVLRAETAALVAVATSTLFASGATG